MVIRPMESADRAFVLDSWLSSFRCAYAAGIVSMHRWHEVMEPEVDRLLARSGTLVATHPQVTDGMSDLVGWLCYERGHDRPLVHYAYVKHHYRRSGVAKMLFRAAFIDPGEPFYYTCKTPVATHIRSHQGKWNPLIARHEREGQPR